MYIAEVVTKHGPVKGVAVKHPDGTVAMIVGLSVEVKRKFILWSKLVMSNQGFIILKSDQYESLTVIGEELDPIESYALFHSLSKEAQRLFSSFYASHIISQNQFIDSTNEFIRRQELQIDELTALESLIREGYARESIVGVEMYQNGKRFSFNLNEEEGRVALLDRLRCGIKNVRKFERRNRSWILARLFHKLQDMNEVKMTRRDQ